MIGSMIHRTLFQATWCAKLSGFCKDYTMKICEILYRLYNEKLSDFVYILSWKLSDYVIKIIPRKPDFASCKKSNDRIWSYFEYCKSRNFRWGFNFLYFVDNKYPRSLNPNENLTVDSNYLMIRQNHIDIQKWIQ